MLKLWLLDKKFSAVKEKTLHIQYILDKKFLKKLKEILNFLIEEVYFIDGSGPKREIDGKNDNGDKNVLLTKIFLRIKIIWE